jgi:methionine-S-sulfoxide reductase
MNASRCRVHCVFRLAAVIIGVQLMASMNAARSESPGKVAAATESPKKSDAAAGKLEQATFGTGCFWCSEAVFSELKGVESAVSGFSGGRVPDPTYEQVCTGVTGHAEVVQVTYDPKVITYPELLEAFWQIHDPTTLNRQGADVGTQYRSVIFYHNEEQHKQAEHFKKKLDESGAFDQPIVTEITEFQKFYPADEHHQNYYALNPRAGYCQAVIKPKMEKFRKVFHEKLKSVKERKEFEK